MIKTAAILVSLATLSATPALAGDLEKRASTVGKCSAAGAPRAFPADICAEQAWLLRWQFRGPRAASSRVSSSAFAFSAGTGWVAPTARRAAFGRGSGAFGHASSITHTMHGDPLAW
jgi:hypothetical protein